MTLNELLKKIINEPLSVTRFSTEKLRRNFMRGLFTKRKDAKYPFTVEMWQDFINIFKGLGIQGKFPCVSTAIPEEVHPRDYEYSLVHFLFEHSGTFPRNHPPLIKAVLSTAIFFIEKRYPGSLLHKFMMVHQLRTTLILTESANYQDEALAIEKSLEQKILEIQYLLEDTKHAPGSRMQRIQQALRMVATENVSLDHRKVALLWLELYHSSEASLDEDKKFHRPSHDNKNFRLIFELSSIHELNFSFQERGDLESQVFSLTGFSSETNSLPTSLSSYWSQFFKNIENMVETDTLITEMTKILLGHREAYNSWSKIMAEYESMTVVPAQHAEMKKENEGIVVSEKLQRKDDNSVVDANAATSEEAFVEPIIDLGAVIIAAEKELPQEKPLEQPLAEAVLTTPDVPPPVTVSLEPAREDDNSVVDANAATSEGAFVEPIIDLGAVIIAAEKELPQEKPLEQPLAEAVLTTPDVPPPVTVSLESAKEADKKIEIKHMLTDMLIRKRQTKITTESLNASLGQNILLLGQNLAEAKPSATFEPDKYLVKIGGARKPISSLTPFKDELSVTPSVTPDVKSEKEVSGTYSAVERLAGGRETSAINEETEEEERLSDTINPNIGSSSAALLKDLREEEPTASLASLYYNANEDEDSDDDIASIEGGVSQAPSVNGSVMSYMPEDDSYNEFLPVHSEFAVKFIDLLARAEVSSLIALTLDWFQAAKRVGARAEASSALDSIKKLQGKSHEVSLEKVYKYLYAILQAMIFAKPLKKADSRVARPYFLDASAALRLLSQRAAEQNRSVHTYMLKTKNNSICLYLAHPDRMQFPLQHQRLFGFVELDTVAENILKPLPPVWGADYKKGKDETDKKILKARRNLEAQCVEAFEDILSRNEKDSTIEDQSLIIRALSDYEIKNSYTPFYNAIRLLAISYYGIAGGVALLGSDLSRDREFFVRQKLCIQLGKCLFNYSLNRLTCLQKMLDKRLWQSIEKIEPSNFTDESNGNETGTMVSRQISMKSGRSLHSTRSGVSRSNLKVRKLEEQEEKITMAYVEFEMVWSAFCYLERPLQNRETHFILKNYAAVCEKTDFDAIQSTQLLHRAFDELSEFAKKSQPSWLGESAENIKACADYHELAKYITKSSLMFAHYCSYLGQLKNKRFDCEIEFINANKACLTSADIEKLNLRATVRVSTALPMFATGPAEEKLGNHAQSFLSTVGPSKNAPSKK